MFFSLKVINDWQTWSETQNAEVEQIKVSLEQYTQAYNEAGPKSNNSRAREEASPKIRRWKN